GGKYVGPSLIESTFKGLCPYVSQFMVYGSDHNFVTALVTLDPDAIKEWAGLHGVTGDYRAIVTSAEARDMVQVYVDNLNVNLNRWEQIKKFTILDHDLTIEDGDLTPSMKLRRKAVSEKYQETLDALYTG
ncbi:MAG: long-chain fatty acid--CoA ligase, partial [Pedococcus sp.]